MKMRWWVAGGVMLGLALATGAQAAPKSPTQVRKVAGVNEYTYHGPRKKKKVAKAETPAPALTLADGQKPPEQMSPAPTTNSYGPAAERPTYTQTHVPAQPSQTAAAGRTYSQNYSPGPNTGKAANGQFTPGGASILTTGPVYYPFPYAGGYGYGYDPILLAPNGVRPNGYYNPYAPSGNCRRPCEVQEPCRTPDMSGNGPWKGPEYKPPVYTPPVYTPPVYTPPAYTPPVYNPPTYDPTGR